jgi:hypothetical protein
MTPDQLGHKLAHWEGLNQAKPAYIMAAKYPERDLHVENDEKGLPSLQSTLATMGVLC